jgi:hypothetical protein
MERSDGDSPRHRLDRIAGKYAAASSVIEGMAMPFPFLGLLRSSDGRASDV